MYKGRFLENKDRESELWVREEGSCRRRSGKEGRCHTAAANAAASCRCIRDLHEEQRKWLSHATAVEQIKDVIMGPLIFFELARQSLPPQQ
jgi:hypothetical protein